MKKKDLKIFSDIPTLYTERLILRKLTPRDLEDVFAYGSDPRVSEYLLWSPHPDRAYTKQYLSLVARKYRRCEFYDWGVEYGGRIIGTVGFTSFSVANNVGEIGYVLSSEYWNMGIGTEAARRVLEFGFNVLNLNRIEAKFMAENDRSRTLATKLGMKHEGVMREAVFAKGRYRDVGIAAITREEYLKLK